MSRPPRSITKSQRALSTAELAPRLNQSNGTAALTPQKLELNHSHGAAVAPPLPPAAGTRVNMLPPAASPPPYAGAAPPPTPPTWDCYSPTTPPKGLARLAPPEASATPVRRLRRASPETVAPELGAAASSAEASAVFSAVARCEVAAARSGGVAAVRLTGDAAAPGPSKQAPVSPSNGLRASLESLEHFGDGRSDALAATCDALGAVDDWVRRGDAAPMWAARGDPRARDRLVVEREVMLRQVRALLAVNTRLGADLARARAASPARSLAFDDSDDASDAADDAEATLLRDRVRALEDALGDTTARLSAAADVATAARHDMGLAQKRTKRAEARSATLEKRLDAESDLDWASQLIRHERDAAGTGTRADAAEEEVRALKGRLARAHAEIADLKGLPLKGHEVAALKTPPQSPSKTQDASSPYHWRARRDTAEAACQATEPGAARDANKARGAAALLRATQGPARRAADARVRRGVIALAANARRRRAVRLCAAKLVRATAERRADGTRRALAVMVAARARQGALFNFVRAVGRAGIASYERRLRRCLFRIFRAALSSFAAAHESASDRAAGARTHRHRLTLVLLRSGARVARRNALKLGLRNFRRRSDHAMRAYCLCAALTTADRAVESRVVRSAFGHWTGVTRRAARRAEDAWPPARPPSSPVLLTGRRPPPRESTAAQRHRAVLRNLDVARARTAEARDALSGLLPR